MNIPIIILSVFIGILNNELSKICFLKKTCHLSTPNNEPVVIKYH